jgi:hypothetical protein
VTESGGDKRGLDDVSQMGLIHGSSVFQVDNHTHGINEVVSLDSLLRGQSSGFCGGGVGSFFGSFRACGEAGTGQQNGQAGCGGEFSPIETRTTNGMMAAKGNEHDFLLIRIGAPLVALDIFLIGNSLPSIRYISDFTLPLIASKESVPSMRLVLNRH